MSYNDVGPSRYDLPDGHDDTEVVETPYDALGAMTLAAQLNGGVIHSNHPSHDFTGIDGRCMWCDCRPFGRHAPHPCDGK